MLLNTEIEQAVDSAKEGTTVAVVQAEAAWFLPENSSVFSEFELNLHSISRFRKITILRFLPYAPLLIKPTPSTDQFDRLHKKINLMAQVSNGINTHLFTCPLSDCGLPENQDQILSSDNQQPIIDQLLAASSTVDTNGFRRHEIMNFDPYFKVEFNG